MTNDEFPELACQVRILTSITARCIMHSFAQRLQEHGADISGLQFSVMRALCHHAHTGSELSRKFVLHPSTLVPVIDSLERKGLVRREHDPEDRRRTPLVLTEAGIALVRRVPVTDESDVLLQSLQEMGIEKARQLALLLRELMLHMPDGEEMLRDAIMKHASTPQEDTTESATQPPFEA